MTNQSKIQSQSLLKTLLVGYLNQLQTHPLRTKAITSGLLSGLQEYVAQELSGTSRQRKGKGRADHIGNYAGLDEKVVKMALYGFFISGPLNHVMFETLNRAFKGRTGAGAKLLQIVVSQIIITPIQNTVYLVAMAIIAGMNKSGQIYASVKRSILPILTMSWIVSPIAIGFAQKFLPPQLWVPFFNCVGFIFGVMANTKAKRAQSQNKEERDSNK
ncbi:8101_t:CDS:2 [Paraglomus occultum]|uniref:8101_t:CDS:1 n=1 Tax=Paraglomus occultum TaxID=144539 RepID=A0A9N8W7S3_9GLOM|nr:8101_t:CDS:2 [Paraglomus occultum]